MVCRQAQGRKSAFWFAPSFPIAKISRAKTKPGGVPWNSPFSKTLFHSKCEEDHSGGREKSPKVIQWAVCIMIHQKCQLKSKRNPHLVKRSVLSSVAYFEERKGRFLHRNNQASLSTFSAQMASMFNGSQASLVLFPKFTRRVTHAHCKLKSRSTLSLYVTTLPRS